MEICVLHINWRFRNTGLVTLTHVLHNANVLLADTLHVYVSPLPLNELLVTSVNMVPRRGF